MVNSAAFCCFSMCLTLYCDEVAISKGTSKGQEHAKTPAASTPPRRTPKQLGQEGSTQHRGSGQLSEHCVCSEALCPVMQ